MRLPMLLAVLAVAVSGVPAFAASRTEQHPTALSPAAATQPAPDDSAHHRQTWEEHFTQANISHDGHLTLEQAKSGYASIARHFTEIDADKKGFVTEEDIRNWHKQRRALHHHQQRGGSSEPPLRHAASNSAGTAAKDPQNGAE
ncbi:MAG: hypothetical protein JO227_14105 [Acetobacteraceae bacterium]|nr:hypothetical protein [Acetobacteraceae bacterium]